MSRKSLVPIVLPGDPTQALEAVTKQYIDAHISAADPHPNINLVLGTQTTGNYVATVTGTANQIIMTPSIPGEGSAPVLSLPQDIHLTASPQFNRLSLSQVTGTAPLTVVSTTKVVSLNADRVDDMEGSYLLDWTNFTNKPDPNVTVALTGLVQGTATQTWTDLAGNVSLSIATTIPGGAGSTLNADLLDGQHGAFYQDASNLNAGFVPSARLNGPYAFNLTGALTGNASTATALQTARLIAGKSFNGTADVVLSDLTAGTYITSTGVYNGSTARTFAVDATNLNTASKIVARDASGDFAAGVITSVRHVLTQATGTAPLTVTSTTKVANLNADLLDDRDATYFATSAEVEALLGDLLYVGLYNAAAYDQLTHTPKPAPNWGGGSTVYRHGMYWVVSSLGTLDFVDSDLSGRYDVEDGTVTVSNGDWIIATDPKVNAVRTVTNKALTTNVATLTIGTHPLTVGDSVTVTGVDAVFNGTYTITAFTATTISYAKTNANVTSAVATGTVAVNGHGIGDDLTQSQILYQFIPFSAEAFVKTQIQLHVGDPDHPHAAAGYLRKVETDSWYTLLGHNHNQEIAQYVVQHSQRIAYNIEQFSASAGILSLYLSTSAALNFFVGSEISVRFPPGAYAVYNTDAAVVRTIVGNVVTISTAGPNQALIAGPGGPNFTAKVTSEPHPYYLLSATAAELYATASHNHDATIAAAITAHVAAADPHTQYINISRGDLRYESKGAVNAHANDSLAHSALYWTKAQSDARYDAAGVLAAHVAQADPHTQYLLQNEADALYSVLLHNHNTLYYSKSETLGLIADNIAPEVKATDGAASARIFVGDSLNPPVAPLPGDLWVQTQNVALQQPAAPTGFAATALSASSVRVSWNAWPTSAGISGITLQQSTDGVAYADVTPAPAISATSYDITTGLAEDTRYWFRVAGRNAISGAPATWLWSTDDVFTQNLPPPAPTAPVVSAITTTGFRLSWTAPAVWPDPGASGARYEVALVGTTPVGFATTTNTYYDFTGLTEVTSYQPKVRAVDRGSSVPAGGSAPLKSSWVSADTTTSNAVPSLPGAFSSAVASTTSPTVTGTWGAYTPAISDFKHYEVWLTTAAAPTVALFSTTTTALTWTSPETTFGTSVIMRVRTVDNGGLTSAWRDSSPVTTKADVLITPTSTGGTPNDTYSISWTAVTGLDNFSGYEIVLYRAGVEVERSDADIAAVSKAWTNLSFGMAYYATLRVKRSSGTAPAVGTAAATRTMVVDPVPGITASGSGTTVSGTLTAPAVAPTGFANYQIELWVRGGSIVSTQTPAAAGAYSFTGLSYSTGYSVRAATIRTGALPDSSWSGWAQADTGPYPDSTPPTLPTGLDCHPSGSYGAWFAYMNWPGGSDHASTQIDRSYNGGAWENWYNGAPISGIHLGTGSAGQTMVFRARSVDSYGNWSGYAYSNTHTLVASPSYVGCSATNSWRNANGGEYNGDFTGRPIQGYYSNPAWNSIGMFYYGDNIRNACVGRTVTGMNISIFRYNGGGNSAKQAIYLGYHAEAWDPGRVTGVGAPYIWGDWHPGDLAWDGSASWPVSDPNQFIGGGARGFMCYSNSGSPYVLLQAVSQQGYQGWVTINHYG